MTRDEGYVLGLLASGALVLFMIGLILQRGQEEDGTRSQGAKDANIDLYVRLAGVGAAIVGGELLVVGTATSAGGLMCAFAVLFFFALTVGGGGDAMETCTRFAGISDSLFNWGVLVQIMGAIVVVKPSVLRRAASLVGRRPTVGSNGRS